MHLYLSNHRPWRTDYRTEDGVVLYKANTPRFSWGGEMITIMKLKLELELLPFESGGGYQRQSQSQNQDNYAYAQLAEIEYHSRSRGLFGKDSRIKVGNMNLAAKEVLVKGPGYTDTKFGICRYGERIFTGPYGKLYVWKMGSDKCRLFLKDTELLVATFHRKHLGILSKARAASVEIFPQGQHMVDDIVTTFIYMERLRIQKTSSGNSAAPNVGMTGGVGGVGGVGGAGGGC